MVSDQSELGFNCE